MATQGQFDLVQRSLHEAIVNLDVIRIGELKKLATVGSIYNVAVIDAAKRKITVAQTLLNKLDQASLQMGD